MKFSILVASVALTSLSCSFSADAALARDVDKKWSKQNPGADALGTSIAMAGTGFDMGSGSDDVNGHLDHIAGAAFAPTMKGHEHRYYACPTGLGHVSAVQDAAVN